MAPRVSNLPHVGERHALQILLSGNWKPATSLYPTQAGTLAKMIAKGWIEQRATSKIEYRITEAGRNALRHQLP
jgi:DNA-binding PadR family transcriptional regulator